MEAMIIGPVRMTIPASEDGYGSRRRFTPRDMSMCSTTPLYKDSLAPSVSCIDTKLIYQGRHLIPVTDARSVIDEGPIDSHVGQDASEARIMGTSHSSTRIFCRIQEKRAISLPEGTAVGMDEGPLDSHVGQDAPEARIMGTSCSSAGNLFKIQEEQAISQPDGVAVGNGAVSLDNCDKIISTHQELQSSPSPAALASLLKRYSTTKALSDGRRLHVYIRRCGLDKDRFLGNCLVEMYGSCGKVSDAWDVFEQLPSLNVYSWNIMINVYAKNGHSKEALNLFHKMQCDGIEPDYCTFIGALKACTSDISLAEVEDVHAAIIKCGCTGELEIQNALIGTYERCRSLWKALIIFRKMSHPDVISWNTIIAACSHNGHATEALGLFEKMLQGKCKPDPITLTLVLDACAVLKAFKNGQQIHALAVEHGYMDDIIMVTSLVNMYSKVGSLSVAKIIFDHLYQRDVVCWNVMIAACVEHKYLTTALMLFHQMSFDGLSPDHISCIYALETCANLAILDEGKQIHMAVLNHGYDDNLTVGTTLVRMYGECGAFVDARKVFDDMPQQDTVSWSAMITAYAQCGRCTEALDLFDHMLRKEIKPDQTTFLNILTACNHAGHVADGKLYFYVMSAHYGIEYTLEHYVCMIDLLGRAGHLVDAEHLIATMPFKESSAVWSCFLGACQIHGDVERGIHAARRILELDPQNAVACIVLSNMSR